MSFPSGLDVSRWEIWLVPIVGLAFAGVAFLMGRTCFRLVRSGPPVEEPPTREADDPFVTGSQSERRRALRRQGRAVQVLISDEAALVPHTEGLVLDRSMGGLRLAVDTPVAENAILSLKATDAPHTTPWVQVRVKTCRQQADRYEVGCEFLRTPSWSILLLFG